MKANSHMELIDDARGLMNISLEENSSAEYLVLQGRGGQDAVESQFKITLPEGASLKMVFISLEGESICNTIRVSLIGRHASCELSGLSLAGGRQKIDYDILMTHLVPECHSSQLFKNIIGGGAVTHFDGLIKVVPDAQKTEAYQANHNLLVSDDARAFTRPQLEIYADDVKCSHGATTGRLNPDELFYMRTRGIPVEEAMLLQQMAFAGEVTAKISSPGLRERIQSMVEKKLRGGL